MPQTISARYFTDHFSHRFGVLTTFRERFGTRETEVALNSEAFRDLHHCSKDIALVMVRSFCEVFGWKVKCPADEFMTPFAPRQVEYKVSGPSQAEARADTRFAALEKVCVAANKCVVHINEKLVDKGPSDLEICEATDLLEEWIRRLYLDNGFSDFDAAVQAEVSREYRMSAVRIVEAANRNSTAT